MATHFKYGKTETQGKPKWVPRASGHWPKKGHLGIPLPDSRTPRVSPKLLKKISALLQLGTMWVKVHRAALSTQLRLRESGQANFPQTLTFQAVPPNPEHDPHSAGPALTGVTLTQ